MTQDILYSTHDPEASSVCYFDGYVLSEVLESTRDYFENLAYESEEYGEGMQEVILRAEGLDATQDYEKSIFLSWNAEKDEYDNGLVDYQIAIGNRN